jgi:hypothetical protein
MSLQGKFSEYLQNTEEISNYNVKETRQYKRISFLEILNGEMLYLASEK